MAVNNSDIRIIFQSTGSFIGRSVKSIRPTVLYYLTRAPRTTSSQVIQDESGAKSGNYLAEFVCVMSSFVFHFIFLAPVQGKQVFQVAVLRETVNKF